MTRFILASYWVWPGGPSQLEENKVKSNWPAKAIKEFLDNLFEEWSIQQVQIDQHVRCLQARKLKLICFKAAVETFHLSVSLIKKCLSETF